MNARVAELLADLLALPLPSGVPAAKTANLAKTTQPCGLAGHDGACEALRMCANPAAKDGPTTADSQEFAAIRKAENAPRAQQACGVSQDSQDSQPTLGKLSRIAQAMSVDARLVLDCLLWLHPDTGALELGELARAARLPAGLVLGALSLLQSAGLVTRRGRAWAPAAVLLRELAGESRRRDNNDKER